MHRVHDAAKARMAAKFANATTWETIGLHFALCGNVLNPDTGKPAELPEL
jgi:hypothetical protein